MPRCVLLLRAVNVGGTGRVPMAELRSALAAQTALTDIETYIQSGNIICDLPPVPADACAEVRALIAREFGVDTPVILRLHEELAAAEGVNVRAANAAFIVVLALTIAIALKIVGALLTFVLVFRERSFIPRDILLPLHLVSVVVALFKRGALVVIFFATANCNTNLNKTTTC